MYTWNNVIIWPAARQINFSWPPDTRGPSANSLLCLIVNPALSTILALKSLYQMRLNMLRFVSLLLTKYTNKIQSQDYIKEWNNHRFYQTKPNRFPISVTICFKSVLLVLKAGQFLRHRSWSDKLTTPRFWMIF